MTTEASETINRQREGKQSKADRVSIAPQAPTPHALTFRYYSVADALKRCHVAARRAMRGERWAGTFHTDCAADILVQVLDAYLTERDQLARATCRCGGPVRHRATFPVPTVPGVITGRMRATSGVCHRHTEGALTLRPLNTEAEGVPREALPMYRLVGMAHNWRVSQERRMERDRKATADQVTFSLPPSQDSDGTPETARRTAVDMLSDLGLARLGRLFPVAYTLAREVDGMEREEVAAELGIGRESLNTLIKRAATKVPSSKVRTKQDHLDATSTDDWRPVVTKRPDAVAGLTGDMPGEWRDTQPHTAPITLTYGPVQADCNHHKPQGSPTLPGHNGSAKTGSTRCF
jgi:hypothetical protein